MGFYEDATGVAYIGSQKSGYELMHRIPQSLLDAVWTQHSADQVPSGATLDVAVNSTVSTFRLEPITPSLDQNGGLSISTWLRPAAAETVQRAPAASLTASCDAGGFVLTVDATSLEFTFTIAGERTTIVPTGMCVDQLLMNTAASASGTYYHQLHSTMSGEPFFLRSISSVIESNCTAEWSRGTCSRCQQERHTCRCQR